MARHKQSIADQVLRAAIAIALLCATSGQAAAAETDEDARRIELNVLYAGNPDTQRTEDFAKFLGRRFQRVETANFETFQPADADRFDVVVFDWTSVYPRDADGKVVWDDDAQMPMPTAPELDRGFTRPVVMIGAAAGVLSHKLQIAINWKCLCLENVAHDVAIDHPIFRGPLPVALQFEERVKPADYYLSPGTNDIDETMPVWKVQAKSFPEVDPGLVSSYENFKDTPDAEVVSGGFNGKGPTSVAIGRHGNFLLWGFSGQPSEMTASARNTFVNAVCYMEQFDGQAAGSINRKYGQRDGFLASIYHLRSTSDEYINRQVEHYHEMVKETPPPASQLEQIGDDPAAYFRNMMEQYATETREKLPAEVRELCGDDTEKLIEYYDDNVEYLRTDGKGGYVVDEDVQQLGVSNRTPALLDKCVELLETEEAELVGRVLKRYTGQRFETADAWRQWIESKGDALRFDEAAGMFR